MINQILAILFFLLITLASCLNPGEDDKKSLIKEPYVKIMPAEKDIIEHVKKAINPQFKDWVLFSNGTYIIFEEANMTDKKVMAIEIMKKFGSVYPGSPAGDISITKLTYTEGWVVGGHYYGMYTYVHPKELEEKGIKKTSDLDIGLAGREKRDNDGRDLKVIYINEWQSVNQKIIM